VEIAISNVYNGWSKDVPETFMVKQMVKQKVKVESQLKKYRRVEGFKLVSKNLRVI
jgi:hypothetical protein